MHMFKRGINQIANDREHDVLARAPMDGFTAFCKLDLCRVKKANYRFSIKVLAPLLLITLVMLSGCTTIAYNTYKAANNPLPIGTQIDDKLIYAKGSIVLMNYPGLKYTRDIHLLVFNKRMLIVGQVPTQKIRRGLVHKLARVQGLTKLYNYLTVGKSYNEAKAERDLLTEFKVTAAIFDRKGFNSYHYYFVVHSGVVYIFGESTQAKLKEASNMLSQVQGVKKVITFYSPKTRPPVEKISSSA